MTIQINKSSVTINGQERIITVNTGGGADLAALDGRFAPIAKGTTNGDNHDHAGGDGGQIAYSSLSGAIQNNFSASTDPGVGDDSADGYSVGSWWWNTTGHRLWQAESVAVGAAVWRQIWPASIASELFTVVDGHLTIEGIAPTVRITLGSYEHAIQNMQFICASSSQDVGMDFQSQGAGSINFNYGGGRTGSLVFWGGTEVEKFKVTNGGVLTAVSHHDYTPAYEGDALEELRMVSTKDGKIDHSTLPKCARGSVRHDIIRKVERTDTSRKHSEEYEKIGEEEVPTRDLGMMVSVLTKGIQQLLSLVEKQGAMIAVLEKQNTKK
jgi:hypothetical protein